MSDVRDRSASAKQVVDQAGISAFHHAFGGSNPIHVDAEAARRNNQAGTLQHGMRTLYPAFQKIVEMTGAMPKRVDAKFVAPVRDGDVVTTAIDVADGGAFELTATNQSGAKVIVGTAEKRK